MNKRTAATLALCLSMSVASYGQNQASKHSVKGVVLDEKGEPVIKRKSSWQQEWYCYRH